MSSSLLSLFSENEKFFNDMQGIMLSGDHSDVTIGVKGEDFKLHRNILAARNVYVQSMFTTEMKEKLQAW